LALPWKSGIPPVVDRVPLAIPKPTVTYNTRGAALLDDAQVRSLNLTPLMKLELHVLSPIGGYEIN